MNTRTICALIAAVWLVSGLPAPLLGGIFLSMPADTRAELNLQTSDGILAEVDSPTVPASIPSTTHIFRGVPDFTGSLEASATTQKMSLFGHGEGFIGVNDTYTVGGSAVGQFAITMTLRVTGTYGTIPVTSVPHNLLGFEGIQLEIGTFHTEATLNQFVVDPFGPDANNPGTAQANQSHSAASSDVGPLVFGLDEQVSYTKIVQVGDVFDLGYDVIADIITGQMDLTHTGTVSFDLPNGVFITSALGANFVQQSVIPEPSTFAIAAFGLIGLVLRCRKRLNSV
jgi:hypothetical protein